MFTPSAVLITGGNGFSNGSVEIYHPDRESPCVLPDLPEERHEHTQDGSLICGGDAPWDSKPTRYETSYSCHRWNTNTGAWDLVSHFLRRDRVGHISWTPTNGSVTYLMGGVDPKSKTTSEVISQDNKISTSFPLKHWTE